MFFLFPEGRSNYNAMQVSLKENVTNPIKGIKAANFQASYSLSRFSNSGGQQLTGLPADNDQDFVLAAADYKNTARYYGPSLLDRTNQISFGGYVDVPYGFRFGIASHFYSPLASAIVSPNFGDPGEIYLTDFTGDGTTGIPSRGPSSARSVAASMRRASRGLLTATTITWQEPPPLRARL